MQTIEVVLKVPAEIAAKLLSGEYTQEGSVVRNAAGKIVKHLEEVTKSKAGDDALPILLPGTEAMLGLQVLNTAIMVAGFALLSGKMAAISRQCDSILDRMETVDQHLQWLRDAGIATVQAKMHAALEGAHTAHRLGQSVLPYDTSINEAGLFFRRMLSNMLSRGDAVRDSEMFALLVAQHAVSVMARARSHWLLLGPEEGIRAFDQGRQAHADLAAAFQRCLRDPGAGMSALLDLTAEQRDRLKNTAALFRYVTQRLTERRAELVHWAAIGLTAPADPETLRQLENHPTAYLIITPDTEAEKTSLGQGHA